LCQSIGLVVLVLESTFNRTTVHAQCLYERPASLAAQAKHTIENK